ncbi:MAG: hypothetical protein LWY06_04440 [Firmicutes bacterium]|nr:hypothetical protein [Bacillota bacterium]
MDSPNAINTVSSTNIGDKREWGRVFSDLTGRLKEKIKNNQLDEIEEIFLERERLLQRLSQILKEDDNMQTDEEFFQILDVIKTMEQECLMHLKMKMDFARNQMVNVMRLKNSKRHKQEEAPAPIPRFIDLKR